jgi:hypothetical protein
MEDEKFDAAEGTQQFGIASVAASECERGEEPWNEMIESGYSPMVGGAGCL